MALKLFIQKTTPITPIASNHCVVIHLVNALFVFEHYEYWERNVHILLSIFFKTFSHVFNRIYEYNISSELCNGELM